MFLGRERAGFAPGKPKGQSPGCPRRGRGAAAVCRWLNSSGQRGWQMGPRQHRAREGFLARQPPVCTAVHRPRAGPSGRLVLLHGAEVAAGGGREWASFSKCRAEPVGGEPRADSRWMPVSGTSVLRPFLWWRRMLRSGVRPRVAAGHPAASCNTWDHLRLPPQGPLPLAVPPLVLLAEFVPMCPSLWVRPHRKLSSIIKAQGELRKESQAGRVAPVPKH